ncbi:MAG: Holliday junction branch migration protein RuvA [Bacteroidales bacterium]|nr:Holliday junction branch migration protein RuvA [Bacteroidales bacterium]
MYDYIAGKVAEKTPTYIILEAGQIGYFINISLNTYSNLGKTEPCKLFIHQIIREDAHLLFGFIDQREREIFRQLISVSGVGANTARMILSSMTPDDVIRSINEGDVFALKSVKGIGAKSAQRIIVDLKDKVSKVEQLEEIFESESNTIQEESLSALVNLGFSKAMVEKVIRQIHSEKSDLTVEELIKEALKRL